jgi:hypothetical protein
MQDKQRIHPIVLIMAWLIGIPVLTWLVVLVVGLIHAIVGYMTYSVTQ